MTLHFLNEVDDAKIIIIANLMSEPMCKLINIIPCLRLLISSLPGSALRKRGLPSDSMFVLEAEPGKLAIKRHSSKILYFIPDTNDEYYQFDSNIQCFVCLYPFCCVLV